MRDLANLPISQSPNLQSPGSDPVVDKVLQVVSDKTGYPTEMLELDQDMEADLGIDTVKQAETFASIRESFAIPVQEGLNLREYSTLAAVVGFVRKARDPRESLLFVLNFSDQHYPSHGAARYVLETRGGFATRHGVVPGMRLRYFAAPLGRPPTPASPNPRPSRPDSGDPDWLPPGSYLIGPPGIGISFHSLSDKPG